MQTPTIEERLADARAQDAPTARTLGPTRRGTNTLQRNLVVGVIIVAVVVVLVKVSFFGAIGGAVKNAATAGHPASANATAPPQASLSASDIIQQAQGPGAVGTRAGQGIGNRGNAAAGYGSAPSASPDLNNQINRDGTLLHSTANDSSIPIMAPREVAAAFAPPSGPADTVSRPVVPEQHPNPAAQAAQGQQTVVPAPGQGSGPRGIMIASVYPQDAPALNVGSPNIPDPQATGNTDQVQTPAQMRTHSKLAFIAAGSGAGYLNEAERPPAQAIEIFAGTTMHLRLTSTIDTSQPGYVWAELTAPVRSSLPLTRRLPNGTTSTTYPIIWPISTVCRGRVDGNVSQGDSHLTVAWDLLTLPNGWTFDLHGMQGADPNGTNGLSGSVNNHVGRTYTTVFLGSLLTGIASAAAPGSIGQTNSAGQSLASGAAGSIASAANHQLEQNLAIPPSIVVDRGKEFVIRLESTIINVRPYGAGT